MHQTPPAKREPTPDQQILALIRTFPCLSNRSHAWLTRTTEFDPEHFHSLFAHACTVEALCARFVLNVWNPHYARAKGWNFDFLTFMIVADPLSLAALLNWMRNPSYPHALGSEQLR